MTLRSRPFCGPRGAFNAFRMTRHRDSSRRQLTPLRLRQRQSVSCGIGGLVDRPPLRKRARWSLPYSPVCIHPDWNQQQGFRGADDGSRGCRARRAMARTACSTVAGTGCRRCPQGSRPVASCRDGRKPHNRRATGLPGVETSGGCSYRRQRFCAVRGSKVVQPAGERQLKRTAFAPLSVLCKAVERNERKPKHRQRQRARFPFSFSPHQSVSSASVTAPRDALVTVCAYLARTPRE
jgi:hypothetical protein